MPVKQTDSSEAIQNDECEAAGADEMEYLAIYHVHYLLS